MTRAGLHVLTLSICKVIALENPPPPQKKKKKKKKTFVLDQGVEIWVVQS